jgi:hypothetical protein
MLTYRLINDNTLLLESPSEQRHESAPELGAHGSYREKEVTVFAALEMMPDTMLVCPASRHNTVNVRMVEQIRTPRMENGRHTGEQALILGKSLDSSPCSLEHTVVEDSLMGHRDGMKTCRQREDDMEVLDRDNLFPAAVNPLLPLLVLALGTMAVTTAVIADMHIPAFGTYLDMPAKGTGPAEGHVGESPSDRCYDVMLTQELPSMTADDLSDVETGPHRLGGKMVSISRTCFIGSMLAT